MRGLLLGVVLLSQSCCFATYYGQFNQDKFVNEKYFHDLRGGVFVDVGAHNGVSLSNTYFFEKELGWTGICVEPMPRAFNALKNNRHSILVQGCVTNYSGPGEFLLITHPEVATNVRFLGTPEMLSGLLDKYDPRHLDRIRQTIAAWPGCGFEVIDVQCYLLNDLLEKNGITHVNFLSLDTEGGEFDIISSIDFSRFQIDVINLEDNYGDPRFVPFLEEKGFYLSSKKFIDLFFVNKNFKPPVKKENN